MKCVSRIFHLDLPGRHLSIQTPLGVFLQFINEQGYNLTPVKGWSRLSSEQKQSVSKLGIITHTHKMSKPSSHPELRDSIWCLVFFLERISEFVPSGSRLPQKCIVQHTSSLPGFISQLYQSALLQNNILPGTTYCRQQSDLLYSPNETKEKEKLRRDSRPKHLHVLCNTSC